MPEVEEAGEPDAHAGFEEAGDAHAGGPLIKGGTADAALRRLAHLAEAADRAISARRSGDELIAALTAISRRRSGVSFAVLDDREVSSGVRT
jgi:hypothetical protein